MERRVGVAATAYESSVTSRSFMIPTDISTHLLMDGAIWLIFVNSSGVCDDSKQTSEGQQRGQQNYSETKCSFEC